MPTHIHDRGGNAGTTIMLTHGLPQPATGTTGETIPSISYYTAGLFEQEWAAWSRTSMKLINGSLHRVIAYQKANQNVTIDRYRGLASITSKT
jgi:hypothetical protein